MYLTKIDQVDIFRSSFEQQAAMLADHCDNAIATSQQFHAILDYCNLMTFPHACDTRKQCHNEEDVLLV